VQARSHILLRVVGHPVELKHVALHSFAATRAGWGVDFDRFFFLENFFFKLESLSRERKSWPFALFSLLHRKDARANCTY